MLVNAPYNYFKALQVTGIKFLIFFLITCLVDLLVSYFSLTALPISAQLIFLLSSAVGFLLVFRINGAYQRWRDGYINFRDCISTSLGLISQMTIMSFEKNLDQASFHRAKQEVASLLIVFHHMLHRELQSKGTYEINQKTFDKEIDPYHILTDEQRAELSQKVRKSSFLLTLVSNRLQHFIGEKPQALLQITNVSNSMGQLYHLEQALFSLKFVPFPWGYRWYTRLFVWILPVLFILSAFNQPGIMDNFLIAFTCTVFVTIEQIANNLDDPITNPFNGVPYEALCRYLEIGMLEALSIPHNLKLIKPKDGVLH